MFFSWLDFVVNLSDVDYGNLELLIVHFQVFVVSFGAVF